ncbi:hypothetical protein MB46_00120 [Arthrobacter alpinus]|uniref:ATP-binding protein n=1 Tax=Arthrobacter alpinus TaxID=656366 RepID=UPI0005C9141E|nr:ATP-binding protein [Arthrobacter alpinus]ALV44154.1 hypothetical protein MB46_00120 [Arthrobacter alpinus]
MGLFSIWKELGFNDNPYSQVTLQADEIGDRLLAGRDQEIKLLMREIGDSGAHPSVEGPIGAGKTSMINVAIYRMQQQCLEAHAQELYLPADGDFQPDPDPVKFERDLYFVLAQTLIKYKDQFPKVGLPEPDVRLMDKWLNEYQYTSQGGGVGAATLSVQGNYGSEPNPIVTESGFQRNVRQLLRDCFPEGAGGIVCVMDNLEILQTAGKARDTLDELRDKVFNIPQVRWVLSGSRGIVSRAKSEKLSGVMLDPMILEPIDDHAASDAIIRRIREYGTVAALAPVSPDSFDFLYRTFNRNLREALTRAGEFSRWFHDQYVNNLDDPIPDDADRDTLVNTWLMEKAELANENAGSVRPRHWSFFHALCQAGGRAGSSEFARFGFGTAPGLSTAVTDLVNAQLVVRELDPDNGQKSINSVTPTGWLVSFFHQNFPAADEPECLVEEYELPPHAKVLVTTTLR